MAWAVLTCMWTTRDRCGRLTDNEIGAAGASAVGAALKLNHVLLVLKCVLGVRWAWLTRTVGGWWVGVGLGGGGRRLGRWQTRRW